MAQIGQYGNYRGRRPLGKLLLAIVLIMVIAAAGIFIFLQRYMVYDENGNLRLELPGHDSSQSSALKPPISSEDITIIIDRKEPEGPKMPELPVELPPEPEGSGALLLEETPLTDWAAVREKLPEGISGVCLTVKDADGIVYVDSQAAVRLSRRVLSLKPATEQAIADMTEEEGLHTIARINCLLDPKVPILDVRALGVRQKTGYLFYDDTGASWLDPTKEAVRSYLTGLASNCAEMGFDEILLTYVSYPASGELDKINYGETPKEENLAAFVQAVRDALPGQKLSLELPVDVILTGGSEVTGQSLKLLAPLVDCIYAETTAADAAELAELVKAAAPGTRFVAIVTDAEGIATDYLQLAQS